MMDRYRALLACAIVVSLSELNSAVPSETYDPLEAVPVSAVRAEGGYFGKWVTRNAEVSLPHNLEQLERSGCLPNFDRAAGLNTTAYVGSAAHDSNAYKVLEGAAWTLLQRPELVDEESIARQVERVITPQLADGYLCTEFILKPDEDRWGNLRRDHVLYSAGHLFEAGAAWKQATGRNNLLNASQRYADLIGQEFGPGIRHDVPGHQEIELALIRLFDETGESRYLKLAQFFLKQRGHIHGGKTMLRGEKPRYADYNQDRVPLAELTEAKGHAVRAGYTYAAMADMELRDSGSPFDQALDALWQDVVERKLYITGASATAQYHDEGFGDPYVLPNAHGYAETCGSIAAVMWNHRMALLHADSKYADVMERTLYNAVMSGISLTGDSFFYTNPLASLEGKKRSPWFNPACCPTNLVRLIPQLGSYAYGVRRQEIFVNLFVSGDADLALENGSAVLDVETDYPLEGEVRITIKKLTAKNMELALRIPGWAREQVVPSDLYRFHEKNQEPATLLISGKEQPLTVDEKGYVRLKRNWQAGDVIELKLPMPVRRVVADERVEDCRGKVALQRGPLVYCLEACDHEGQRTNAVILNKDVALKAEYRPDLLDGTMVITGEAQLAVEPGWGEPIRVKPISLRAIPYALWANRETGTMDVWLAQTKEAATPKPGPTAVSSAKLSDSAGKPAHRLEVIRDGRMGPKSTFRSVPRYTWGPDERFIHIREFRQQQEELSKQPLPTNGWLQCEWEEPVALNRTSIYWAEDRAKQVYWWTRVRGLNIDLPKAWNLFYRDGQEWKPVKPLDGSKPKVEADVMNDLRFEPIITDALRLKVEFQKYPAAVQEWKVGQITKN